jgi:carboxylesterase type B
MKLRRWIVSILAFVLLLPMIALTWTAPAAAAEGGGRSPVVHTDKGAVQGVARAGVDSYLGVRYAKAPVGRLRWQPPRPAAAWTGVLPTTSYGNRCAQPLRYNAQLSLTEDCLFLNVQRPTGTRPSAQLPVWVYIHGGGLNNGSASQHDGTSIVQQTGLIVVTINYRLGVLGWLGLPALTARQGESGNYGLQDQIAALTWVRHNIAAFGGDPNRVTIGGESSGAFSVCALLSAPAAAGLFSGAIMESGYCDTENQDDAHFWGNALATQVGCEVPAEQLACLRAAGTQTLLDGWDALGTPTSAVSGTPTLPLELQAAIQQDKIRHVPLLIGSNRDEGRYFSLDNVGLDKAGYEDWLKNNFSPEQAAALEAQYPWPATSDQFTAAYLTGAIFTDGLFGSLGGCPYRDLVNDFAQHLTTFVYEFDHRTGPGPSPQPVGYVWGASHTAELPYLWPSFDAGIPVAPTFNAAERQLSRQMIAYWGAFVKNGRPTAAGQPRWPALNNTQKLLSLRAGNTSTVVTNATFSREHKCSFWASFWE